MEEWNDNLKRLLWLHFGENPTYPKEFEELFQMFSDLLDANEKEYALLNRIMDLSSKELFDANMELRKRNSELDSLVYSTTHDLRAPLTSILGLLELIEMARNEEEKKDFLDKMKVSAMQLDHFINDIVDYTHNKKAELTSELIDFESLINKCFDKLGFMRNASAVDKKVSVNVSAPFRSDLKRLENMLSNLISNSIKYCNLQTDHPMLEVSVDSSEKGVLIRCVDNGVGIKAEHLDKVFNMFHRASATSKGSGIGLYIVKEIVDKLNGEIALTSEVGIGTTFEINLPTQ